jgi:hypothetical protein
MACEKDFLRAYVPVIFATGAFFMGLLGNLYCETIAFEPQSSTDDLQTLFFGVYYYKGYEVVQLPPDSRTVVREACFQYPEGTEFDAKWKTAKSFAIITPIIGGFVLFWSWLAPCWYVGMQRWRKMAYVFLIMTLFQGLTLIFLSSSACKSNPVISSLAQEESIFYQQECSFGWGTKVNIAAVVFWFIAGVLMLTIIPPPRRPARGPPETQTVTYTQTEQPDGTKIQTETTVKGQYIEPNKTEAVDTPKEEPVNASAQMAEP